MVAMHAKVIRCCILIASGLFPMSVAGQSIRFAEVAANHCMYEMALEHLSEAPSTEQQSAEGLLLRTRLLIQLERGVQAVAVAKQIPLSSNTAMDSERLLALALAHSAAGQLDEADVALRKGGKLGHQLVLFDEAKAVVLMQRRNWVGAERILLDVLRRDPLLSGALYNLAAIRARQNRIAEAASLVRQAWHAGLKNPDLLRSDPDLKAVTGVPDLLDDLMRATIPSCSSY